MKQRCFQNFWLVAGTLLLGVIVLGACSQALPTTIPSTEMPPVETPTSAAMPTQMPTSVPTQGATVVPTPISESPIELRIVELEWPATLKLGDSDVIRLSLIPSRDGYTAQAEYGEHTLTSQEIPVKRPSGYLLSAIARLEAIGFDASPSGDQRYIVTQGEAVTWRWNLSGKLPGRHRIAISLLLRWEPDAGITGQVMESLVLNRSMDIRVVSFLGLRKPEVFAYGLIGLVCSGALFVFTWRGGRKLTGKQLMTVNPDINLSIESPANMVLDRDETNLIQALFRKYQRLIIKQEFMSGYSGARTFLAHPVKPDGQSDAETIIKIGRCDEIEAEYEHYETYVKDRLPPITARIQNPPVRLRGGRRAALQYTCISEPGKSPISLRQSLLTQPDPALIQRLFDTFGSYWWMQRQPYTFRLAQEYDRLLPSHLVLAPAPGHAKTVLQPNQDPSCVQLRAGDLVKVSAFDQYETRIDGKSLSLNGQTVTGRPIFRVRWLDPHPPAGTTAQVVATRKDLLRQYTENYDLLGLPDPLLRVETWLQEVVNGTSSVIHGDLNLENILVGPGTLLWLIDFAQTREGHPLFDFSHLASELIAHLLVETYPTPLEFLTTLREGSDPLLHAVEKIAAICMFDIKNPREYHLSLIFACIGALKYRNLSDKAKHYLYLAAAYYGSLISS